MSNQEKIVIKSLSKPEKENFDALIAWFCKSFDMSGDANALEPTMFKEIVGASFEGSGITSRELNDKLNTPRTTVIYHLNRFISSGLIVRKRTKYFLRSVDMESTIEEMQADMFREFNRMMQFAEKIDQMMTGGTYVRREERRKITKRKQRSKGR